MPVDIAPLMDSPWWKSVKTPAQRKELLEVFQDPNTSEEDRGAILQMAQQPLPSEPSGAARVVSSVGGMLREAPAMVSAASGFLGRAGGQDPNAPPGTKPQTPQEWEAALLPIQQQFETGANAIPGLMMGPAMGKAGYMGGQALSKLAAPWIGKTAASVLPAVGEAGAGYASRRANVAMGTEQPGVIGDIASAVVPLAFRGATSAPVARRLPGSAGAQHEMVAKEAQQLPASMQPSTPSVALYESVAKGTNPEIAVQSLRQHAQDIIEQELKQGPHLRSAELLGAAQDVLELATEHGDYVPMDRLYATMKRVGEKVKETGAKQTAGTRGISGLYARFHAVLDDAANSNIPEAATLKEAIKASRQEHAVEKLENIVGQGKGITTQQGSGYTLVSGKKMLNDFEKLLADDEVFRGSFTADELRDMRSIFENAGKLPALPPPGSVQRGAGKFAINTAIGTTVGGLIGGPQGAAIGAGIGSTAPEIITRLMMTKGGREMLKAAFEGRDILTPQALAVLNQAARQVPETYTSKRP